MNYENRLRKLQEWLIAQGEAFDALLITNSSNIRYLSGFTGTFAFLVIGKNDAYILTDSRYVMQSRAQSSHFQLYQLERFTPAMTIANLCGEKNWAVLAFERQNLSFDMYDKLMRCFGRVNLVAVENAVEQFRAIKDEDELSLLEQAEHIGDIALAHVLSILTPGMTEKEVAFELEYKMRQEGASGLSFDTIVASGYRSAMPHGVASDKIIEKGDLVVCDFGCVYEGYCSDMTRTFGVGHLSDAQKDLYHLVLKAQQAALKQAKAGVVGQEMQKLVQDFFDNEGVGQYFGHGLGHSVGLDIHEEPRFSRNIDKIIPSGTVITVEPGLYIPEIGGVRIEDMITLTENGHKNFTHSPKELLIV